MYVSMYVYMYVYMYICIDECMYVCIYVCLYVCMYVCIYNKLKFVSYLSYEAGVSRTFHPSLTIIGPKLHVKTRKLKEQNIVRKPSYN